MSKFSIEAIEAAKQHARDEYPNESCGLIVRGEYVPTKNIAKDPSKDFEIASSVYQKHLLSGGLEAVVHSHPDGPLCPSHADMETQLATGKTWILLGVDADLRVSDPIIWGGDVPIPHPIGREFVHGVTDCYSLIRDTFRLGKDKLAELDVCQEWPFDPIDLPDLPREDNWWNDSDYDHYEVGPPQVGFVEIKPHEVQPGDVFFIKIMADKHGKYNHAGVYLGDNLILHHLPKRLSRRELAGTWGRQAGKWMRYVGPANVA